MKHPSYSNVLLAIASAVALFAGTVDGYVEYVDTLIGTGGYGFGVGSLNPGPQVPFGAMRLGPDTSLGLDPLRIPFDHFGGYYYHDNHVRAFSHTHMVGSGASDFGNFGVMPVRQEPSNDLVKYSNYKSKFSHSTETSVPGLYSVFLEDHNSMAELTVSGTHSGIHRYTCVGSDECTILIDVCHTTSESPACSNASVAVTPGSSGAPFTVDGFILNHGGLSGRGPLNGVEIYFHAELEVVESANVAALGFGVWDNDVVKPKGTVVPSTTSNSAGAYVRFPGAASPSSNQTVEVRVGISFISPQHAKANLAAAPCSSFDACLAHTRALWDRTLSGIVVHEAVPEPNITTAGGAVGPPNMIRFYSALYRSHLAPTIYTESDGSYLGFDGKVHSSSDLHQPSTVPDPAANFTPNFMSDMSIWDIHRSQMPLLALVAPTQARDTALSLVAMFKQGGRLPRWPLANIYTGCMIGSHAVVVLSDFITKRVPGFDFNATYEVMKSAINAQDAQHPNYTTLGYVPLEDDHHAASLTLAMAYDDGALAASASALNRPSDQKLYRARSMAYKNLFSKDHQVMCPRSRNGTLMCPDNLFDIYPFAKFYTEGDAWQWQWFVPHDLEGLAALYSSPSYYFDRLDQFFNKSTTWFLGNTLPSPYYWAGNEPDILAPWQFAAAGSQYISRTQYWSRWLVTHEYTTDPAGVPGNDDYGTMSAWATFAMLGFYPVSAMETYVLGSPVFANVTVTLPFQSTPTLTVIAHGSSPDAIYVSRAMINGIELPTPYITHKQLVGSGGTSTLEFFMSSTPPTTGTWYSPRHL